MLEALAWSLRRKANDTSSWVDNIAKLLWEMKVKATMICQDSD